MTDKSNEIRAAFGMSDEDVANATGIELKEPAKSEENQTDEQKKSETETIIDKKTEAVDKKEELEIDERFKVLKEDGSIDMVETLKKVHGAWGHLKSEVGRTGQELGELRKKWNAQYLNEQKKVGVEKPVELTEEKLNELLTTDLKSFKDTIKKEAVEQVKRELYEEHLSQQKAVEEDVSLFSQEVAQWYKNHPEAQELEDDMGKIFGEYSEAERMRMASNAETLMDTLFLKAENRRLKEKMKYTPKAPAQENKTVSPKPQKAIQELSGRAKMIAEVFGMSDEDISKNN